MARAKKSEERSLTPEQEAEIAASLETAAGGAGNGEGEWDDEEGWDEADGVDGADPDELDEDEDPDDPDDPDDLDDLDGADGDDGVDMSNSPDGVHASEEGARRTALLQGGRGMAELDVKLPPDSAVELPMPAMINEAPKKRGRPRKDANKDAKDAANDKHFIAGQDEDAPPPPPKSISDIRFREQHAKFKEVIRNEEDLASILSEFEFGELNFKIELHRITPEFDPTSGDRIKGFLQSYSTPINYEQIRSEFGGGSYDLVIRGPSQNNPQRVVIRGKKRLEVAGEPRMPDWLRKRLQPNTPPAGVLASPQIESLDRMVEKLVDQSKSAIADKNQEILRTRQAAENLQRMLLEKEAQGTSNVAAILTPVLSLFAANQQASAGVSEAAKLAEVERMKLEAAKDAERIRAEKEMRVAEINAIDRRMEQDRKLAEDRMAMQQKQMLDMISMMQANTNTLIQTMQMTTSAQIEQLKNASAQKEDFLLKLVTKEQDREKEDPFEQFMKFKKIEQMMNTGRDPDDKPSFMDQLKDIAPAAGQGILTLLSAVGQAQRPAGPQPALVATVSGGQPPRPKPRRALPAPASAAPAAPAPAASTAPAVPATPAQPAFMPAVPDAPRPTGLNIPSPELPLNEQLIALVKNVEVALNSMLPIKAIVTDIVGQHSPDVQNVLRAASAQQVIEIVATNAPKKWTVNSPRGRRAITEMLTLLKAQ